MTVEMNIALVVGMLVLLSFLLGFFAGYIYYDRFKTEDTPDFLDWLRGKE